ncbi:hypothetical protein [Myroides profundi]|uniref:Uncharacterized protein n=1 Tax=Myroides profundi TaxID=480520 RepID=A0AAJ5BEV6_MYRPR|nr:hypothetical protein [Myroides profundi]AJH15823.1 hypothetical protein MPR_2657 [Myroides profundi]SER31026.1 hypothetical protein SAMN04488089_1132 [Myroides profundi]
MKKYYYLMIACFSLLTLQAQVYEYPLTGTEKPSGIVEEWDRGGSAPSGSERYTTEGIVLSHDRVGYSGFAIDDLEIDLRKGTKIEFEYAMSSILGTGYGAGGGMTFFLFDAEKKFKLGYGRSALGYAYNESNSTARLSGLAGGYLGIGFDLSGGFKGTGAMRAYEMREGISNKRYEEVGVTPNVFGNYYDSHITLRGAIQGNTGFRGNPVLYSQYYGYYFPDPNETTTALLDYNTGAYKFERANNSPYFNIANGGNSSNPNFQKIIVELVPEEDESAMYVTVKAKEGNNEVVLIDNFYYKHNFKTYAIDGYDFSGELKEYEYDFNTRIPNKVKIGFVGLSIDFAQQKTIIRNVKVSPIDDNGGGDEGVDLEDEYEEICISKNLSSEGAVAFIDILEDTDYNVDWSSFMFVDVDGNKKGDDYYSDYYAKWEYDRYDKQVKMTVQFDFYKPEENLEIYYSVLVDGVRSKPAMIRVRSIECGAIANPQINTKSDH